MSRTENLLNALLNGQKLEDYEPQSRIERLLKRICCGENCDDLEPESRIEYLLKEYSKCSGGSKNEPITITENGVYTAPEGVGYSPVEVVVPRTSKLKAYLDETKSAYRLFYYLDSSSVDHFLDYNDTENVTDMRDMFVDCRAVTIPLFNTSKVTTMNRMFYHSIGITTIPQLDTSNVTDMGYMLTFSNITTIPLLNTSKVTDMSGMFRGCKKLTTIPLLDTSNVINMAYMFNDCTNLTSIPALDTSKVTNMGETFTSCTNLKSILMYGMKVNFNISSSTKFEREDLVTILNNLATVRTTYKLTMGSTNLAKLTDEDKAIATGKGWTLA